MATVYHTARMTVASMAGEPCVSQVPRYPSLGLCKRNREEPSGSAVVGAVERMLD